LFEVDGPHEYVPEEDQFIKKLAWVLPLLRRDTALELLIRPKRDVYTTLARRLLLRFAYARRRADVRSGVLALYLHVHTCASPDSLADVGQVLEAAGSIGLSGVAITDHNTMDNVARAERIARHMILHRKLPDEFVVIPGEEISTSDGHVIGLFLSQVIPPGMTAGETIEAIHEQGGIAIAAHPLWPKSVSDLANTLPFDAVETANGAETLRYAVMSRRAQSMRAAFYEKVEKPRTGGSDAHDPDAVGQCFTLVDSEPSLGAIRTAILAGKTTPVDSVTGQDSEHEHRHGFLHLADICESIADPSPFLQRLTHSDSFSMKVLPKPVIAWSRRF
jgi:predicted metal-dependent phosphoesterase TrpH